MRSPTASSSPGWQRTPDRHGSSLSPPDLRRAAATLMAESGEMDEVIDAVLNHAKQGIIRVYNQFAKAGGAGILGAQVEEYLIASQSNIGAPYFLQS